MVVWVCRGPLEQLPAMRGTAYMGFSFIVTSIVLVICSSYRIHIYMRGPRMQDHLRCEQGRDDGLDGQRCTYRDSNCVHMQSPRLRVCTQAQLRCCKVCSAQVRQLEPLHIRYEAHSLGTSSASWSGRQLHTSPSISWHIGPKISAAGASSYTILRPVCHTLLVS